MRAVLAALCWLWASSCAAAIGAPILIGTNSAAAGSTTLVITTTKACAVNQAIAVGVSEVGATNAFTSVTDSAGNTYSNSSTVTNTLMRSGIFITGGAGLNNVGLISGGTITVTYAVNTVAQAAIAICIPGTGYQGLADGVSFNNTNTNTTIVGTPTTPTVPNDITLSMVVLTAGAGDTYTESAGYTLAGDVSAVNYSRLSYQIVPGLSPTAYSATNSSSRVWARTGRLYKAAVCVLSAVGAGQC